jgi:protein-disulfide isomerase
MKQLFTSSIFVVAALFAGASFAEVGASPVPSDKAISTEINKEPEHPKGVIENKLISDAPLKSDFVLGKDDAAIVMVEYASLSCPHCAHFNASIMPELQKKYIDTGKIRYVLRQYPLNEPALRGAMLVNCVGKKQGAEKYYQFNKVLFDAQSKWAFDGNWQSALETIAAVGGINKEEFDACLKDTDNESAALKSKMEAQNELRVPHTPYLFIGGEAYNDNLAIDDIAKFIDRKIAEK